MSDAAERVTIAGYNSEPWAEELYEDARRALEATPRARAAALDRYITEALEVAGVQLVANTPAYDLVATAVARAAIRFAEMSRDRDGGDWRPLEGPGTHVTPGTSQTGLTGLLETWAADRGPSPKSRQEWNLVVRRFNELHGDLPVAAIERRHVLDFKDQMSAKGSAPATVRKHLGALSALLEVAVERGMVSTNAAAGIKVHRPKVFAEARIPWSAADLELLFTSPMYAGCRSARKRGEPGPRIIRDAKWWLPALALVSGLRLEECAQLTTTDIREESGVYFFDVTDRGEGRVKTASSRRRVPVHGVLVSLGLLEHVRGLPQGPVWPDLKPSTHGQRGAAFSKWFGRYKTALGVDSRITFHSFRHTHADACRDSGLPRGVMDQLRGHADGGVSSGYGRGYALSVLNEWTQRITFPINLRRLRI
jgi:integrase